MIPQADYNLALAAVPAGTSGSTQDTLFYAGTVDLYRCSLAAGCVLRNTTNAVNGCAAPAQVAPAQHAIAVLATSDAAASLSRQRWWPLAVDGWRQSAGRALLGR